LSAATILAAMELSPSLREARSTRGAEVFAPFATVDGDPACGLVLVCDHAANRVPASYGDLGLPEAEFQRHIAYDPGAAAVTQALAAGLGAPAVLSTFSRLLIDANRGEDDPTLIMRLSDGAVVPGNARVDAAERAHRIAAFHAPYHTAIAAAVDRALATGVVPAIFSVHSFTPAWRGARRPWHAGVLWDKDSRLAVPLITALRADAGLVVGDNEPYAGALLNDTMCRHATRRGLAHALIEIRQDLIAEPSGVAGWGERLAAILKTLNRDPNIHRVQNHGSLAD
jgi:predicted N-formylglutamate amidohydrolase